MDTLEPLLSVLRPLLEEGGWVLSGLQKTTSYEYDGAWEGTTLRSAYAFFHLEGDDEGDGPSLEAYLDETEEGLEGALSLVMAAPGPDREPGVAGLMGTALDTAAHAIPDGIPAPVSITYSGRPGATGPSSIQARVRFKARMPSTAIAGGERTLQSVTRTLLEAFEEIRTRWAVLRP
ncbi:MAG: hypothetical protein HKN73_12795 [Gemmatimonadetes bacterium]|nr:hypothetical protein [Gemmatimonadota bacterium]